MNLRDAVSDHFHNIRGLSGVYFDENPPNIVVLAANVDDKLRKAVLDAHGLIQQRFWPISVGIALLQGTLVEKPAV